MKTRNPFSRETGSALLITMIMCAVALVILASMMTWATSSTQLTHRSIQYTRSVSAAEAATEKVFSHITHDFLYGGENQVVNNLTSYQNMVPNPTDSDYWANWEFNDGNGNLGQTFVQRPASTNYVVLNSTYAGLQGFVSTYTVVSHARETDSPQDVMGGVLQQLQLTQIPIFQFAMYSSGNMEISCGEDFNITGRVHSNGELFVEPDSNLTFDSGVTAVVDILFQRDPLDTRGPPAGGVVYEHPDEKLSPVAALTLPIGTTNTPEAIREIIEPPPTGENANSPLGQLRYYNQSDLVVTVSDTGVTAATGAFDGQVPIPPAQLDSFLVMTNSFQDAREGKIVLPVDINVGNLKTWTETNQLGLPAVGAGFSSIYVNDTRNLLPSQLAAVRVFNGMILPTNGLTVATGRPLYVKGDFNELNPALLGTNDTSATRPASLVGDAITILSDAWQDSNSGSSLGSRNGANTTVNAAILTGVVETTEGHYSGGMENFPRFLESWGDANTFTYNGSMVKMFPSLYATNFWISPGTYYQPPVRNWAYDVNFDDPLKLPPNTPRLSKVIRGLWQTVPPGQNVASVP